MFKAIWLANINNPTFIFFCEIMLIENIILEPEVSLRYMERYVNDGSPSGFTAQNNTSLFTSPEGPQKHYKLYIAEFPESLVYSLGALPQFFFDNQVFIHPDMANLELITKNCSTIKESDIYVSPTSSSRTVEILNDGYNGYLKLNYKGLIGRFERQITQNRAIASIEITEVITNAIQRKKLPDCFAFYPEPGARVAQLISDNENYEWGIVFRSYQPFPYSNTFAFIIPAFSLFSKDIQKDDELLLIQLVEFQKKAPAIFILENIIFPIIDCYFELLISCALQLECHAQNVLFGFDENCNVKGIIFRDMESADKDLSLATDLNINLKFKSFPYRCITRDQYNYSILHSFMYDFKLGEYLFTPLIDTVKKYYNIDVTKTRNSIKIRCNDFLKRLPNDFFPRDNKWYDLENIVFNDFGEQRPYIAKAHPKYR